MSEELPFGWTKGQIFETLAPLSDGRILHQGWSPQCERHPAQSDQQWAALKTTSIQYGIFDPSKNKLLPSHLEPRPLLEVKEGDILLTCAGPRERCGVSCLIEKTRPKLMISGKMYRFRANEEIILAKFLASFLRCSRTKRELDGMKTGISESGMNMTHERFSQLSVPIPPKQEQRRIIAKIESLCARTAQARDELIRIPKLIERYRQALLAAAFNGQLTADWRIDERHEGLPSSWKTKRAEALFDEGPTNGYSPKAAADGAGTTSLKLSATTTGTFILNDKTIKRLVENVSPGARCWLRPGDILIQRANSMEYVGATAIFDGPADQYVYPDLMMRVRINSPTTARLFWRYMSSDAARTWLRARATGTAGNMPKISGAILKALPVPFPPEDEQAEIIRRLDESFSAIETLASELQGALSQVERLDQSILDKAIAGKLVPQDPADEPASALLERIKAARAAAPIARRGSRARSASSGDNLATVSEGA